MVSVVSRFDGDNFFGGGGGVDLRFLKGFTVGGEDDVDKLCDDEFFNGVEVYFGGENESSSKTETCGEKEDCREVSTSSRESSEDHSLKISNFFFLNGGSIIDESKPW